MSSSILTGATGRAYGFDIENVIKSTSMTSSRTSHSSSPSSTISESSNSPVNISNRKPRTPRKRPNQTYNEAAVLLSIACPKVFSTKNLTNNNNNNNISKYTAQNGLPFNGLEQNGNPFCDPPPELVFPFPVPVVENSGILLRNPVFNKPNAGVLEGGTEFWRCDSESNSMEFDTESILDEEIEEGIDSIMGSSNNNSSNENNNNDSCLDSNNNTCYEYPMGLGFGGNLEFNFGFGMRNGIRALKNSNSNNNNWWNIPAVKVVDVLPEKNIIPAVEKKKKKKKKRMEELMTRPELELGNNNNGNQEKGYFGQENNNNNSNKLLLLKLNYDDVLSAWSDKGSPLPEEISGSESADGDIHTRLAQIDLFSENGGLREASVMRYKEKKRTRLFSKKIRYQVRKVNADRRPRSNGRFVRRPSSEDT
ncbi:protein CHLOROPLAST IMPORT APPARATUS 2-like [Bidens hawaiensis]|uniref:protein CHLOROPLAST IMPORT APPARATUS 2-like n=1 Tax=Bidens hawaiensis TaxID=980011 RepID=UPI0040498AAB